MNRQSKPSRDLLDARLARDLHELRQPLSAESMDELLHSIHSAPAPDRRHPAPMRGRQLLWAAASLLPLALAIHYGWQDSGLEPSTPGADSSRVIQNKVEVVWNVPENLFTSLERGAELERERLVHDLSQVGQAVFGDLPISLDLERLLKLPDAGEPR